MHNGMVQIDAEKMAKSVGNISPLHEALDRHGRDALVMYFVAGHYHQPIAYSDSAVAEAAAAVERIRELCRRLDPAAPDPPGLEGYAERFFDQLADNFNTPAARAVLFEWVSEANRRLDGGERVGYGRLGEMLYALGLENLLEATEPELDPRAAQLLAEREEARAAQDFGQADRLRDELGAMGYEVRDGPTGPYLVRRG
jgi:cysteinyl-tRNA synthetase